MAETLEYNSSKMPLPTCLWKKQIIFQIMSFFLFFGGFSLQKDVLYTAYRKKVPYMRNTKIKNTLDLQRKMIEGITNLFPSKIKNILNKLLFFLMVLRSKLERPNTLSLMSLKLMGRNSNENTYHISRTTNYSGISER